MYLWRNLTYFKYFKFSILKLRFCWNTLYVSLIREHMPGNTHCYGKDRTRNGSRNLSLLGRKITLKFIFVVFLVFAIVFYFKTCCNNHNFRYVHAFLLFTWVPHLCVSVCSILAQLISIFHRNWHQSRTGCRGVVSVACLVSPPHTVRAVGIIFWTILP